MIEQLTMFSDPLEEKALEILRRAASHGLEQDFESHHGGDLEDISYYFNPRDKTFYYSDKVFNSWRPESYVRRKTLEEIKQLFPEE